MNPTLALVGVGGFAREVANSLLTETLFHKSELCFVDVKKRVERPLGLAVLDEKYFFGIESEKRFVVAISDSKLRSVISDRFISNGCIPVIVKSRASTIGVRSEVGAGSILCPGSIVTDNVKIGIGAHLNLFTYVAHDCVIGNYVTFAPRVSCNGNVWIDDHVYLGTGSIILPGTADKPRKIGEGATIGAGAVVVSDVEAGQTVVGVPARPLT